MSKNKNNFKTIQQYFADANKFIIPYYQRGYKWGVPNQNGEAKCSVDKLMLDLINAFQSNKSEYFLQGVTVSETTEGTTLIDGQQRTTTLFLLLHYLNKNDLLKKNEQSILDYTIRQNSKIFLSNLIDNKPNEEIKKDTQDVFYFEKALKTIKKSLEKVDKPNFTKYLLENVKIIYINIPQENAIKSFTMLNGQKAKMTEEELIKAKLLSESSRAGENAENTEWEVNELRSKYAREWDKWLYWWNRTDVKDFFGTKNTMGLLLEIYFEKNKSDKKDEKNKEQTYSFNTFASEFIKNKKQAKDTFLKIRKLQKHFEDWFNDAEIYNYLGLVLKTGVDKSQFILWLLSEYENKETFITKLKDYAKWHLIGTTHLESLAQVNSIHSDDKYQDAQSKALDVLNKLSEKNVYGIHNDLAGKQLLRRNIEMDNVLKRKFDFSIYSNKSLEHIYPKSWENEEESKLKFEPEDEGKYSVHSIGNLVLLSKNDNSSFSNSDFEHKKSIYFSTNEKFVKWSMSLLHTVSIFSQKEWNETSIKNNQAEFLENFEKTYNTK